MKKVTSRIAARPSLNRGLVQSVESRQGSGVYVPPLELLDLPEKAVQFGTGSFLRGFVDYFIDKANRAGCFGGRVVMIGSTESGRAQDLNAQDGLYTLAIRGVNDGRIQQELRVIGSVSRAISASTQWADALACARNPSLELIFSNTTEVGIALDERDEIPLDPPHSFPGKLTRFLLERSREFRFDPMKGVVVIPCELIENNGDRLKEIVLALASQWKLEAEFSRWIDEAVPFPNTLVDRIVPGVPAGDDLDRIEESLGYHDRLVTAAEIYRLFAIEGDDRLQERLGFAKADPGIVVAEDIRAYRERKIRLLNGTHTIMVPVALLAGCETVLQAVQDDQTGPFIRRVLLSEIVPSLDVPGASEFAREVLERFANPFIRHELFDITLQGTTKLRVRVIPSILSSADHTGTAPSSLAFGFAAFLLFMRGDLQHRRRKEGREIPPDEHSDYFLQLWADIDFTSETELVELVERICSDTSLWGVDLTRVPGFTPRVAEYLGWMTRDGIRKALRRHLDVIRAFDV